MVFFVLASEVPAEAFFSWPSKQTERQFRRTWNLKQYKLPVFYKGRPSCFTYLATTHLINHLISVRLRRYFDELKVKCHRYSTLKWQDGTGSFLFDWEFLELIDELVWTQSINHLTYRCKNILGPTFITDAQLPFEVSNEMFSNHYPIVLVALRKSNMLPCSRVTHVHHLLNRFLISG